MLTFDKERHEYRWDGQIVPSVSEILRPVVDYSRVPTDVLERKRQIGVAVHEAIALDLEGDLDEESLADPGAQWWVPYFMGFRKFRRENPITVLRFEQPVYHKLGYAGTPDLVAIIAVRKREQPAVIDHKTPLTLHSATALQLAAYKWALVEEGVMQQTSPRLALRLAKDGTYELKEYHDYGRDLSVFQSLLNVYYWKERNGLL